MGKIYKGFLIFPQIFPQIPLISPNPLMGVLATQKPNTPPNAPFGPFPFNPLVENGLKPQILV